MKKVEFVSYEEKEDMMLVRVTLGPVMFAKYERKFEGEEERNERK